MKEFIHKNQFELSDEVYVMSGDHKGISGFISGITLHRYEDGRVRQVHWSDEKLLETDFYIYTITIRTLTEVRKGGPVLFTSRDVRVVEKEIIYDSPSVRYMFEGSENE